MDLFSQFDNSIKNLLPYDGTVNYYGCVFPRLQADNYYDVLLNTIEWKNDEAIIFGKRMVTKRKVAWYGEKPFEYQYSNVTKIALPFTNELLEIKKKIEELTNETYNSCLLNLYHDGSEGMAWHSDGEKDLKKNGAIASVTFGAERKFGFKHKETKEVVSLVLQHGSLLVMKDETQTHWLHRLPPTKKVHRPRVNLTFRTIVEK
ncbi:alpha-ketoglutarate-dependent dioxygenase AlkB family protein [Tenacibaculum sp. IB213877]|uniref:alpha-ketoglutarate-dependent dioxygenase AlkB family protein n=1 Tax=Tenacibaculum sp. IB213877 TaxID=3097351 RepID=UPI002A598A46|nr:alpha-ketoglutarate-dependent dioxygenase AlkB [Tenacibaculum sp. IB213877]MDY0779666.1 alpha-ketoglutarate-dependent dioxygenase AlkB [Tenacibaculum sp. IB213877]